MANGDPLPGWMTFTAASRSFTGTPPSIGKLYFTMIATLTFDPVGSDPSEINSVASTFIINGQNNPPAVGSTINSASPVVGSLYTLTFDPQTFTDLETDSLFYFANMASGDPLPPYAYFLPTTRTFRIISPVTGINNFVVKAYDRSDQAITTGVKITFTNAAPLIVSKIPALKIDT
jgi:hypothetical protein